MPKKNAKKLKKICLKIRKGAEISKTPQNLSK